MASLQDFFCKRVQQAKNAIQKIFGFQPLYDDFVDDTSPRIVAILPKSIFEDEAQRSILEREVKILFSEHELIIENCEYYEEKSYNVNWCGSRHNTLHMHYILEFVISVNLQPQRNIQKEYICSSKLPKWSILEVDYDTIKPESQKFLRYSSYEYMAVLDTDNKDQILEEMKASIVKQIARF